MMRRKVWGLYEQWNVRGRDCLRVFHVYDVEPDAPFPLVDDFDAFIIGPTPIFAHDVDCRKPREQVVEECREEPEMRGLARLLIDNFLNMGRLS